MHSPLTGRAVLAVCTMLGLIALWVICLYLLMETTKQLLDVLHYVVELAQLS